MTDLIPEAPVAIYETVKLETLQWDELLSLAIRAREAEDEARWLYGDIARVVKERYGTTGLDKFAREVGVGKDTIERYRRVSTKYNPEVRKENQKLSWSHFRAVEGQEVPQEWLERANDNDWSVEQTRVEIQKETKPTEIHIKKPRLIRCKVCGKWYIDPEDFDRVCEKKGKCDGHSKT